MDRAADQRLAAVCELVAGLAAANTTEDVCQAALDGLLSGTGANRAAILIFDDDGILRLRAWRNLTPECRHALAGYTPWPQGTRNALPVPIPDVSVEEGLQAYRDILEREQIRALAFVPLTLDAGVLGSLVLHYAARNECTGDDLNMARAITSQVALALERRHLANALARSECRLQTIIDHSSAVILVKDLQGRFQLINRRFEGAFHFSKQEVIGKTDYEIFPREIADRFRENDREVLTSGQVLAVQESAPQDDGVHTYISNKFPMRDPDGTIAGICGIAADVTNRKVLGDSSLHLAAIVESSDDAIIGKDLNGIIRIWNKGAERIFGYTAAEAIGRPITMLAAAEGIEDMRSILNKIRRGERIDHYETIRRRKDGETIHVSLTVSPVRDESGRIIGASKIARDISDRKNIERERTLLLAREQETRKTAELLNRVGPMLASELDTGKLAQTVTDLATELVGGKFGSFFHNVVDEKGESYMLYTLSGAPREAFAGFPMPRNTEIFAPTFRGQGLVRSDDITKDARYGKSGPYFGMPEGHLPVRSYLAAPVMSRSGEVLGGLFFGHPLEGKFTVQHEAILSGLAAQAAIALDNARLFEQAQWAQSELKRSNEDLRRANQDLETFAYSASHDLQEPLRTMAISAQLLERNYGKELKGDAAQILTYVVEGAQRMESLIQDILAYSTATRYTGGPPPSVHSGKALAIALANLDALIKQYGATVTFGPLPVILAHENRLVQLFQNLIGNALKYRREDAPRVHISTVERDGWSVFSLVDNGIGIDRKFADYIFGLFKRLHNRQEHPGSGIGLAICQRIVEQYGGRIWLEDSAPGAGSTFCFTFPTRT
ncbi:MAG TPA: PAS domain S-box protein [Bryobacteraceae bacterium]|nr:PAS domain S-box protein [Bryobacteraceae bacterium]